MNNLYFKWIRNLSSLLDTDEIINVICKQSLLTEKHNVCHEPLMKLTRAIVQIIRRIQCVSPIQQQGRYKSGSSNELFGALFNAAKSFDAYSPYPG